MSRIEDQLKAARENAEKAREIAEKEYKQKVFKMTLELAKRGAVAQDDEHFTEAIKSFQSYLRILENYKKVKEHGLTPQLFDPKKDVMELLLISGIYWDLAKIYDKSRKPNMVKEFRIYLQKFILFSKKQPFSALCSEQLRKYIDNDKPLHTGDFKSAYTALTGQRKCFVATALQDVTEPMTLHRLWNFRDIVLIQSWWGRGFIRAYDFFGPILARMTDILPKWLRGYLGKSLSRFSVSVDPGKILK